MKEFTRIITVQIEATHKDVDEKEIMSKKLDVEAVKTAIVNMFPNATYVNITEAKDFIKD